MKCLVLVTWADCENKWRSLQAIGHEVHIRQYDMLPSDRHMELVDEARLLRPDFIVFIGSVPEFHPGPVLSHDVLRRFRDIAPSVHMCNDAADEPWWKWLQLYDRLECFSLQVNIDGAFDTPISTFKNRGLTLLTPVDHRVFRPRAKRPILMSLVGGHGHSQRGQIVGELIVRKMLSFFEGPTGRSYKEMADILCGSKFVFNHSMTGSAQRHHVKGRVIEAGFAGAALIEYKNSPTASWFNPGFEYFYYEDANDIAGILAMPDTLVSKVAKNFHNKVIREHHPRVFWDKVLTKAGVIRENIGV